MHCVAANVNKPVILRNIVGALSTAAEKDGEIMVDSICHLTVDHREGVAEHVACPKKECAAGNKYEAVVVLQLVTSEQDFKVGNVRPQNCGRPAAYIHVLFVHVDTDSTH